VAKTIFVSAENIVSSSIPEFLISDYKICNIPLSSPHIPLSENLREAGIAECLYFRGKMFYHNFYN
jgi:hypothetical protein